MTSKHLFRAVVIFGTVISLFYGSLISSALAGNTVSIVSDTAVYLSGSGITLILAAGSSLDSYSVGSTTLTVNLDASSNVAIKSNNLYTLTNSQSQSTQCSGTAYSYVTLTTSSPVAVSLTPSTTIACTSSSGGGGGGGGGAVVSLPTISSFSASPASVLAGQSSSLSWSLTGASRISITPVVGSGTLNPLSGTATVTPATTTSYTLTAFNIYGQSVTATTTVTVLAITAPQPLPTTQPSSEPSQPAPAAAPAYCLVNHTGTFYLILNGIRHGITDSGMLYSYGYSFSSAIPDTASYEGLPTGNLLSPNDGALVKSTEDPTVYLIADGQRHGFTSASVFQALGFRFSSVLVVTSPELVALPLGAIISDGSSRHLSGVNIAYHGTVYSLDDTFRSPYPSLAVYNSWNRQNNFSTVVPANGADLAVPAGPSVTARSTCKG